MFVSVVITCRDRLAQLRECLPMVLAQTHEDLAAIVVDYGCPEHCGEWAESLDEARVTVVRVPEAERFNAAAARNAGIRAAEGEAVWLLDADTLPRADWLASHLPNVGPGTYVYAPGSILVTLANLQNVGGFNEMLVHGWGWEDNDLFNRLNATGVRRVDGESVSPQPSPEPIVNRHRSLVLNHRVTAFKGL